MLGLPLQTAINRLEADGAAVSCREVRCRKGGTGNDARVIMQLPEPGGRVVLVYSLFSTAVEETE